MAGEGPSNQEIAAVLDRIADLLETQDANPFRIQAYRNGAQTVSNADESLAQVVREKGAEALQDLPNIGEGLSRLIAQYVRSGRSDLLNRLQGEVAPKSVFTQVPGIGDVLAERIVEELGIETLEELEMAAHDGRLAKVEGFGPERVREVRISLAGMLSRSARRRMQNLPDTSCDEEPDVATLLDVDAEYRRRAEAGDLTQITPQRFNPDEEAWLPIMHTERGDWNFTVLYSNTAQAHRLNKTHDWVVIYYDCDSQEDQVTVVTGSRGELDGRRVVRGRELDTRRYYEDRES